ncbi:MAG: hypothetical protein MJ075_05960 [Oscillospiraceae bacterium]|nr:hypothetical protein [Oscillospiraceae bacterium]
MEEMFEYLVPLQGLFKKKRNPKTIESYKRLGNYDEILEDFKIAKPYLDDAVRIGQKCIFRKEKVAIFYLKDVIKVYFRVHGNDSTDEYGAIHLVFCDGSEDVLYKTSEIDCKKVTETVFTEFQDKGIETAFKVTR